MRARLRRVSMAPVRRALPLLLLAVVAAGAGTPAVVRADYEETERRLKAVGVDDDLRADVHRAIDRAVAWFAVRQISDGSWLDPSTWAGGWGTRTALTTISALEKACIFAGIERIGDRGWYEEGARGLLALQEKDGRWGIGSYRSLGTRYPARSDVLSTAFALLFLLRASEVYRPETPSPVDVPKTRVVTGAGSGSPSPESPAPSPLPNAPPK